MTKKKFLYNLSRASYEKNWGKKYQPPTFWENFLAFLTKIIPKIGPLRVLQLSRRPRRRRNACSKPASTRLWIATGFCLGQVSTGQPDLPNDNFDTGAVTGPGKYRLNDEAHAKLLDALAKRTLVALRRSFGPNSWNSTDIRMLRMRQSKSPKRGRKSRPNLNN